nr:MAG TPA: Retrotransposon hot spot protein [Bacteriophage sp.]
MYLSTNPFIYERNQLKRIFEDLQKRVTVRNRSAVTRHTRKQKQPLQSTQPGRGKSVWASSF